MKVVTTFCMDCKFYKPEASYCSYWDSSIESTGFCSEAKEKQKVVRGKRANWIGFGCDEGILWINFLEGKQELERYDD